MQPNVHTAVLVTLDTQLELGIRLRAVRVPAFGSFVAVHAKPFGFTILVVEAQLQVVIFSSTHFHGGSVCQCCSVCQCVYVYVRFESKAPRAYVMFIDIFHRG